MSLVDVLDTVSVGVPDAAELVVRNTVPEGVVTTTTLGGVVMATCEGSVSVTGVELAFSCCSWWFMA